MLFPSKVTSYRESIFPMVTAIAQTIKQRQQCSVMELYQSIQTRNKDISDFIDALVFLYATSTIDIIKATGEIYHVN